MTDLSDRLSGVLRVAHDVSLRGAGISLREALARVGYEELRSEFEPVDLLPSIQARPEFIEEWCAYSEDKRTTGGWYVLRSAEIGRATEARSSLHFDTLAEAVAHYVVQELDFWAGLSS